ncbi:MAG: DUF6807 family protein [Planctomycetota bacterium]
MPKLRPWILMMLAVGHGIGTQTTEGAKPEVHFDQERGKIRISIGGEPFGTYVYRDPLIPRPYFVDVHAPGGIRATRNHPPIAGKDLTDHDRLHPGIWVAFGDLDGGDFWRNKARIEHVDFLDVPRGHVGKGGFAVKNRYVDGDRTVCEESVRYSIVTCSEGWLLTIASEFLSEDHDFAFGDQEEMGLGIRVATPISVKQGGKILNSDGLVNEAQAWGKQADWCLYGGNVETRVEVGFLSIVLMPDPRNVRRSWFHARDYGFIAANPFGQNAFTKGEKSRIVVRKGEVFKLIRRFPSRDEERSAGRRGESTSGLLA